MSDKPNVTVLGTGIMGAAMARNLARAGHEVTAWNRSRDKAEPLTADGVRIADTPAEAVANADAVITILHDGPAALDVMRQAAPDLRPGTRWIQSTTAGIEGITDLAAFATERDLVFFDAPVLGTREPAEAGKLTVLASGPSDDAAANAVFDAIGAKTVWISSDGADGGASRLKLVANSWVFVLTHGIGEVLALAEGLGVDPQRFYEVIDGGPLDAGYARVKGGLILNGDAANTSFGLDTAVKDARLIVEAARASGVRLDLGEAGAERFRRASAQGHGDEDMAASYFASFNE
ncbi:NAD(P)-dependent oxidoreductase [Glycomyces lechevalierae]|uniref:3-hydroxyisobutyrate dehydrogenase n=1 Tax=Glycomyces lechevalierae TaxID=256034 RepID=A0A9X3PH40_9ACTN|nr:NAD(P)-dependent oxidoreductase [Glycomyces lechevalierae]MDA1383568.1 NAD(P)-dependent oxidoreductase [Glycomyces lechevalierae]MDR7341443.1 3-hydroxyisobutyrate dehydrogenase [Glycomyces lechevalierae]